MKTSILYVAGGICMFQISGRDEHDCFHAWTFVSITKGGKLISVSITCPLTKIVAEKKAKNLTPAERDLLKPLIASVMNSEEFKKEISA